MRGMGVEVGTSSAVAALPWEWFDFEESPRAVGGEVAGLEAGGWRRVYRVVQGGRVVPFKVFRREGARGAGERPWLIMLHGMGLGIATFRGVAGYLLETHDLALVDYSSLMVEESGWPAGGVPVKVMAEGVWGVAEAVRARRVSLAGNSLGGGMCLVAALLYGERVRGNGGVVLEKMLLSNPACYPQQLPLMYRVARVPLVGELILSLTRAEKLIGGLEHIGYVDKGRFLPELRERYLGIMASRRNRMRLMEMIRHLPANERDLTPAVHLGRLREIEVPVLLTWGEQDPLLVAESGPRLAGDLGNCAYDPHADLAHLPHEEAPERVGKRWAGFLRGE